MSARPDKVVIVGHDAPLWLAAAVLHAALRPSGVSVEAVELPARVGPADMYATQPPLEALHNQLRIGEAALLRATRGSFSLGQKFIGAGADQPSFFHAYGSYGAPIDGGNFLPLWLKARRFGLGATLADFSLTAGAALHGRMLLPDEQTESFGRTDYGYHLPAAAYARSLRGLAVKDGIAVHQATQAQAVIGADGSIEAVALDGERRVEGAFFLDATGDGQLIAALGVRIDSWRDSVPVTHVLRARGPGLRSVPPYAEVRATANGWAGLYPSQTETRVLCAYAGMSDEAALAATAAACGFPLADARVEASDPGRRTAAWARNCVAIGGAACRFDPAHEVALHAIQLGLVHLLPLFPVSGAYALEQAQYNRVMQALFERVRDFQGAHYVLNRWKGVFWDAARQVPVPPELAHKIATFRARGELSLLEDESFTLDSWNALFVGHGVTPDSYPPSADRTPPELMKQEFRRILGFIKDKVLEQPTHDAYLADYVARRAA